MYLPAGKQTISPLINGKPAEQAIELEIDEDVLPTLQSDLEARLARNVRPFGDFDHKPGPAAFLPKRFFWQEDGIHLEVDWTGAGRKAVKDRDYSYLSPSFLLADNKIVGLPQSRAIGSLVNNPAFQGIKRIACPPTPPKRRLGMA